MLEAAPTAPQQCLLQGRVGRKIKPTQARLPPVPPPCGGSRTAARGGRQRASPCRRGGRGQLRPQGCLRGGTAPQWPGQRGPK